MQVCVSKLFDRSGLPICGGLIAEIDSNKFFHSLKKRLTGMFLLLAGLACFVGVSSPANAQQSTATLTVGTPTTDANGVKYYPVSSLYQGSQPETIRVLQPTNPAAGQSPKILYVLPIDTGVDTLTSPYSDGLEELRLLNVQNLYNMTLIAPSFNYVPWFGDDVNDATRRMESFVVDDLVPFGDSIVQTSVPQRYLIGFSKSGNAALFLIMRHPGVFNAVAAWDAPVQVSSITSYVPDMPINFGTQANFDLYNIPSLISSNAGPFTSQNRIWISGDQSLYQTQMDQLDAQMTTAGILHTWVGTSTVRAHNWSSGWLSGAASGLDQLATLTAPAAGSIAPPRTGGRPFGALPSGTTQATLTLNTDQSATCRYGTSAGTAYSSISNTFLTTGGTSHSTVVTGLQDGGNYTYYVRCKDNATSVVNADDYAISFSVAVTPGATGSTASSSFSGTESPLSENGLWDTPGSWDSLQKNNGAYSTSASSAARLVSPVTGPDQFAEITYDQDPGTDSWVGVTTRVQGSENGGDYLAIVNAGQVMLFRTDDSGTLIFTQPPVASAPANLGQAPRLLRLESQGSTHRVYFNGALAITYVDPSNVYPSGQPGIAAAVYGGPTVKILSFTGGALPTSAATPTFNPPGGTYTSAQSVTISDTTPGVTIYYTTDGSTPTTSSTVYSSPIQVTSTQTLMAIAVASGGSSGVASATYTIQLTAATPTFSVPGGTYTSIQMVAIGDTTAGVTIYYTTDGSTPTTSSTVYSSPIQVTSTETIKAIATASGYSTSDVASATYTIQLPAAATPTFSVPGGTYTSAQTVAISDTTAGVTIYYTTDGSTPTSSSTVYSSPIQVSTTTTLKAIAAGNGYSVSSVATATYTIQAATPAFSLAGGTYTSTQTVAISDTTAGVTIYYTTDGSTPTTSSAVYSSPIQVSTTKTIKAIAAGNGYSASPVASATYTIQPPAATPTFSMPGGTYTSTQTVAISDTTAGVTIYYTTDGSTPSTSSAVYSSPIQVTSTTMLKAIASGNGYSASPVASATYTIQLPAATPTFSVPGGTYTSIQTVTITDATPGATIYYTTDGTTPTTSSTQYSSPIPVSSNMTLQAIAAATGYLASPVASATYTIQLPASATPTFSVPGGTYTSTQTVTISDTTPGAIIYYTTDGTTPTTSSTQYSSPIQVSSTETINAIATATGYSASAVASATYTIPASFTFAASPGSLSMNRGGQGAVTLTVTPQNGFNSAVNFACSGLPSGTTCSFSPTTVTPSGSPATATLTIAASTQAAIVPADSGRFLSGMMLAGVLCLFGWRRRRGLLLLVLIAVVGVGTGILTGCGGSVTKSGTQPVNATVTVTATSGSVQKTASVALTVN